jgi:Transposase
MVESTTVTVGLDVHARSIRLAAIRAAELLEERTLPYDEEAVERLLRRWPAVRCCYEAGPTGFGLYRHLTERGIDCAVVAPGLVPQRPGDRVKTDPRDARKLARLHAGGLLAPIQVPSRELVTPLNRRASSRHKLGTARAGMACSSRAREGTRSVGCSAGRARPCPSLGTPAPRRYWLSISAVWAPSALVTQRLIAVLLDRSTCGVAAGLVPGSGLERDGCGSHLELFLPHFPLDKLGRFGGCRPTISRKIAAAP